MKKIIRVIVLVVIGLLIIYLAGPKAKVPELDTTIPTFTSNLVDLEKQIFDEEAQYEIRPGNETELIWADSNKQKTEYAVVYVHGFSSSPEEGEPIHKAFAERYGFNLYVPRLFDHGLVTDEPLLTFTPEGYINSVAKAVAVGRQLGEKVILMSCSTGGTASLYLASGNPDIHSLIMYSPNIDLFDTNSSLLIKPWGHQIFKAMVGGDYHTWDASEEAMKYWYTTYRIEAIIQLKALVAATMTEGTFAKIKQPAFMGYYYKNEQEQDDAVSVKRMLEMFNQLGTVNEEKRKISFPESGTHGIQSKYASKDYKGVANETYKFAEQVLGFVPVEVKNMEFQEMNSVTLVNEI